MRTPDPASRVQIVNEPSYSFGSGDNSRRYDTEVDLTDGCRPSSVHGVIIDARPTMVIGDAGGASGVHAHSLLVLDSRAFVAVGAHVVCLTLGNQEPDWTLKTDEATCFGVYYDREHDALISHGEISICRFSREGEIIWSAGGADIYSEGFSLLPEHIEAIDFDHRVYHFDYLTGESKRHNKPAHPRRVTSQFEFGLPAPPWMAYTLGVSTRMNISSHSPRDPEPRIVYWFVHPSTVPPTPLGFIRTSGRAALLIGGLTGSHMTGHKDTWQDKFQLLISEGYLAIEAAQAQGLVSASWKPPALDHTDYGIVSRIQSGEI